MEKKELFFTFFKILFKLLKKIGRNGGFFSVIPAKSYWGSI